MNILILYHFLPYPKVNHGGGIRVFKFIEYFSQKNKIFLFCMHYPQEQVHIKETKKYVHLLHTYSMQKEPNSIMDFLKMGWTLLFSKYPIYNHHVHNQKLTKDFRNVIKNNEIDLIYCENLHMAHYIDLIPNEFKGKIYLHDDEIAFFAMRRNLPTLIKETFSDFAKLKIDKTKIGKLIMHLQFRKYLQFEKKIWAKSNYISAISANEKRIILQNHYNNKNKNTEAIFVFHHGIDSINKNIVHSDKPNIIFTGNYGHMPNVDAVLYFGYNIFPIIQNKITDAKFLIVGSNPPKEINDMAKLNNNIKVLGYVEKIESIYDEGQVFVAPIRLGGGFRAKIIDAMAYGLPIVSTSIGVEGLKEYLRDNTIILKADEIEEFAYKVISLLENEEFRNSQSQKVQKLATEFLWENIFHDLEKKLLSSLR